MPNPATTNLFHVSGIFTQKALWEVLRFFETMQGYSVEVRPVAPPSGLLAAPEAEATKLSALERTRENSAAGRARAEILAELRAGKEVTAAELRQRGHDNGAIANAIFFLTKAKLAKRVKKGTYVAAKNLVG